jgi:hypothetical protein
MKILEIPDLTKDSRGTASTRTHLEKTVSNFRSSHLMLTCQLPSNQACRGAVDKPKLCGTGCT